MLRIYGILLPTTLDAGTLEDLGSPIQPGTSPTRYMGLMARSLLDHEKGCKCLCTLQDIQELANGEVLSYDANTLNWKNQTPTSGNLSTLSDIAITEPISDSSSLIYNTFFK